MGDVRIRYGWAWVALLSLTFVGAGLMTSTDPTLVRWGIALIIAPLALTGALLVLFYMLGRRQAE